MCEDRFSPVLATHFSERIEVDEICDAFVKARPRRPFLAIRTV